MITKPCAIATRLAFFYGAAFAAVGIHLPFWPVWLEAQGLSATEIGYVIAAGFWPRVVTNPLIAREADRLGERRRPMALLAVMTLIAVTLFSVADGFWAILGLSLLAGTTWAAILPLGEALALRQTQSHQISYGRVRAWGSISFVLVAIGAGRWLEQTGPSVILPLLGAMVAVTALACVTLPETKDGHRPQEPPRLRRLLQQPGVLRFIFAAGLIQVSHSVYYSFATLHWRAAGHGEAVIGWLWAEGVIAEVLLFFWAGALLLRVSALQLLILAGSLAALRWCLTAASTDLLVLILAQALHAATFGAAHLAAIHHLRDITPPELQASAQALYAAIGFALLFGLITPVSGWLYETIGGMAFLAMAGLAVLGTGLAATMPRVAAR